MQGWCRGPLSALQRVLFVAAALLLIKPGVATDVAGVALAAVGFLLRRGLSTKSEPAALQIEGVSPASEKAALQIEGE